MKDSDAIVDMEVEDLISTDLTKTNSQDAMLHSKNPENPENTKKKAKKKKNKEGKVGKTYPTRYMMVGQIHCIFFSFY